MAAVFDCGNDNIQSLISIIGVLSLLGKTSCIVIMLKCYFSIQYICFLYLITI